MRIHGDGNKRMVPVPVEQISGAGKAIFQLSVTGRGKVIEHLADPGPHAGLLGRPGDVAGEKVHVAKDVVPDLIISHSDNRVP
jgi:hypothetical protein